MDIYEFKTSLVCTVSFRTTRAVTKGFSLSRKTKQTKCLKLMGIVLACTCNPGTQEAREGGGEFP